MYGQTEGDKFMSNTIKIDSNVKNYDFVDADGNVLVTISFNPSDINIVRRYEKTVRALTELKFKFKNRTAKTDLSKLLDEVDAITYEKIDYLLNAKVSDKIFSIMGPFSPLESGKFFVEVVMDAIGQIIKTENKKRADKVEAAINKHTAKYVNKGK